MTKYAAFGIALVRDSVEIAQVKSISGPGLSLDVEDVTSHDQTAAWEEVVATILRSGEITLELAFDPALATHKNAAGGLLYDLAQRAKVTTYVLTFPDATEWSFTNGCYVTGFEPGGEVGGALTATVKLKPTGAPTLA